jgi:hypothetical protein
MITDPDQMTAWQLTGLALITLGLIFCSMEVVPAWSRLHLDWPAAAYYALMALLGGLGGALIGRGYFLPGLFGGILAGLGGLAAMAFVLERTAYTNKYLFVIVAGLGSLPGVGVGYGLRALQDRLLPPYTPSLRGEDAVPRRRPRDEDDLA